MNTTSVLSIDIARVTRQTFRESVVAMLSADQPAAVAKVNAEFLLRSLADHGFRDYLGSTHFNVADGIGVLWAARFLTLKTTKLPVLRHLQIVGQAAYSLATLVFYPRFCRTPIPERIPGVDALMVMLEAAEEADAPVYFLGAAPQINKKARADIQALMPGLKIAGGRDGYVDEWGPVLREIDQSGATMLIVALGCPKQEFWIRDHLGELKNVKVAVGEGGSLDFIAGDFRRAPRWLQAMGLEWLWRLFMNRNKTGSVSRAHRIWNAVPVFIHQTIQWKLRHGWVSMTDPDVA